jgi:aldose 1-epimerase
MSDVSAREEFGTTASGEVVERVKISNGGLTAYVMTWGAVIQDLRLEGHEPSLVLGFDNYEHYPKHSSYFGATPGRNSNRIDDGKFSIDGEEFQLELNERGVNHLHGGSDGIAKRNWTITSLSATDVVLSITDPDGRAGYPGTCEITVTYRLGSNGTLSVIYDATTDRPTIANLCQHSYFNLDGSDTILDHEISIIADHYLPVTEDLIPTGEIKPVDNTEFDLRVLAPIRRHVNGEQVNYDHNFCLSGQRRYKSKVATLRSPWSGVQMDVFTTEPGVQFYSASKLNVPVAGHDGRQIAAYAGLCLETQIWPDAINHEGFPDAILRPGEVLRQETDYVFSKRF